MYVMCASRHTHTYAHSESIIREIYALWVCVFVCVFKQLLRMHPVLDVHENYVCKPFKIYFLSLSLSHSLTHTLLLTHSHPPKGGKAWGQTKTTILPTTLTINTWLVVMVHVTWLTPYATIQFHSSTIMSALAARVSLLYIRCWKRRWWELNSLMTSMSGGTLSVAVDEEQQ